MCSRIFISLFEDVVKAHTHEFLSFAYFFFFPDFEFRVSVLSISLSHGFCLLTTCMLIVKAEARIWFEIDTWFGPNEFSKKHLNKQTKNPPFSSLILNSKERTWYHVSEYVSHG